MGWDISQSFSMKTFYSKYSPYPDLFCYWNSSNKTSPINPIYKALDRAVIIRGPVIIVRVEPAKSYAEFASQGVSIMREQEDTSPWTKELGIQEMIDTLKFYQNTSFCTVNHSRTNKRYDMFHEPLGNF